MFSTSENPSSKLFYLENTKLMQDNQNLLQEIIRLRETNQLMEERWERGLKNKDIGESKAAHKEKKTSYSKLEENNKAKRSPTSNLYNSTSGINSISARTLQGSKPSVSQRRNQIEELFSDESLLSSSKEYPIWEATIQKAESRANKAKEELMMSENSNIRFEERILSLESQLNERLKPLQRRVEELEMERATLRQENTMLELLVQQKDKEKNLFADKLLTSEKKLGLSEDEIQMLKAALLRSDTSLKQMSRLKVKITDLENENLKLAQKKDELQLHTERAERECRKLKEELENGSKYSIRDKRHAGQVSTASEELETSKLRNEITLLKTKIEELEAELKENKLTVSEYEKQKNQAQETIDTKEKQLKELERAQGVIEEQHRCLKVKFEEALKLTNAYKDTNQELEAKIAEYSKDIKVVQSENDELRSQQSELEALKKKLQEVQLEKEALEIRALIAEDENSRLRENVSEEVADEERIRSNLKVAEFEKLEVLRDYKNVCIENQKMKAEVEEILSAHKDCLRDLRDTKTEKHALQAYLDEVQASKQETLKYQAVYEDINQKLIDAQNLIEESEQNQEKLMEDLINSRKENEKTEASLKEAKQAIDTIQKENEELKQRLSLSKEDIEVLREELDKKTINNEVLKGLIENQKKNQWKYDSQDNQRLHTEDSYVSNKTKSQESRRKGINSDRAFLFFKPQERLEPSQWDQGFKEYLKEDSKLGKSFGVEDLGYGGKDERNYFSRGVKSEKKSKYDSTYLPNDSEENKKKKFGSLSLAYEQRYLKF